MWNILVRQSCHAVAEDIAFIIKRIMADFVDFNCPQDVIGGKEGSE